VNSIQNPAYATGMEARFAAAARHSRMVRVLRVAVPGAVLLALASIVLIQVFLNPFQTALAKLPVDMSNLVVSGTKITMETPHLAGFSTDQRPYELWAKAAVQDLTDPDHVELKTLRAKVMMEDKSTVTMDARTGFFDSKQQLLDLRKDIFLQSSTGYEATLSQVCRHQQGNSDVGRACRRQIAEWHAHSRPAQDHQQRRDRALRRQRCDEPDHGKSAGARARA